MKVAIVQEQVDARRGGAETSTREMAAQLARLGVDVTVLCHAASAADDDAGVHYLALGRPAWPRLRQAYEYVKAVHAACRGGRFDVVHAVTPCLCADVYQPRSGTFTETLARNLARTSAWLRPLKRAVRVFNLRQRFLMRLERRLLTRPERRPVVAAISEYVAAQVHHGLGFPAERVRVIANGVDVKPLLPDERMAYRSALRRQYRMPDDRPLVLFVAHNFRLKGLTELIRAAALAGGPDAWTLAVAGRDGTAPFEKLAERLGIRDRVHFVRTDHPVRAWYAAADLLAHPTWYDPCSRVVLEALSIGLPVVTTRYNGAAETIPADRRQTTIDEPADTQALAAAIAANLTDEARATSAAQAGYLHGQLSMARHARELVELYEEVVRARRTPRG